MSSGFDCCAVGRPVALAASGEAARLAEVHQVALRVEPGDPAALASAVRRLDAEPELRSELVASARAFAAEHLRERQADRLVDLLHSVAR